MTCSTPGSTCDPGRTGLPADADPAPEYLDDLESGPHSGVVDADQLDNPAFLSHLADPVRFGFFGPGGPARRVTSATLAVVLIGVGVGLHIAAGIGATALDALTVTFSANTGTPLAFAAMAVIGFVVLCATVLGQRPGVATAAVVFGIGPVIAFVVDQVPAPGGVALQVAVWLTGTALIAVGSAALITARLGTGAVDLLALAFAHRQVGSRTVGLTRSRAMLEALFLAAAVAVGAPIGAGTVAFAVIAPPAVRWAIPAVSRMVFGPLEPGLQQDQEQIVMAPVEFVTAEMPAI